MAVVVLKNISKTFNIGSLPKSTAREKLFYFWKRNPKKKIKALDNINFEIEKGDFFGILGRNGSGKSTLLRIILGSMHSDKGGEIYTEGKIIRLALGLGFDKHLTARENIYINGSIIGLTFQEVDEIFDEIINFSELQKHVDVPIRNYSSGMMSRLKFSIALHAKADIFLMDEFFGGVGDIDFQKKSKEVFETSFLEGRTIIHVSHNLETIRKHCNKVLILDRGKQVGIGSPEEMIPLYESLFKNNGGKTKKKDRPQNKELANAQKRPKGAHKKNKKNNK